MHLQAAMRPNTVVLFLAARIGLLNALREVREIREMGEARISADAAFATNLLHDGTSGDAKDYLGARA
jgi:hypothetical protein